MKKCFKCHKIKALEEFYKHPRMSDGHVNKCKECNKKDNIQNRNSKHEYYLKYDRDRADLPHRAKAREEYQKRPYVIEKRKVYGKNWQLKNPEKRRAHSIFWKAFSKGKILKKPCIVCGNKNSNAHHDDYMKPLDVIWFCHKHHMEHHKMLRRGHIGSKHKPIPTLGN